MIENLFRNEDLMSRLRRAMQGRVPKSERPIKKVLVIDNHNLMFRCIAGAWKHDIMDENFTYWKYLVINQICTFINMFKPDRVIFAMDARNYWRKDIFPEYKATRKKGMDSSDIDFEKFFPVANEFYEELERVFPNVCFLCVERCEADDLIAVLTKHIIKRDITVVTTDKDMYQLMKEDHYQQYDPIKKKIITVLNPQRELDVKIIMGDKGDNISAIQPRTGPATAKKILDAGLELVLEDENVKELYIRNKKLIDFDYIPDKIVGRIKKSYSDFVCGSFNGNNVFNFLMKHRLGMFIDAYQNTVGHFKELR